MHPGNVIVTSIIFMASAIALNAASIIGSKHDLSTTNFYGPDPSASKEVCVFCHTPHASNSDIGAPLWNRKLSDDTVFVLYGGAPGKPNGVTLGCLSCHDGVSSQTSYSAVNAFDQHNLVNPPNADTDQPNCNACHHGGGVLPGPIWQIGSDLSNDHPVSVSYEEALAKSPTGFSAIEDLTDVKLFNGMVECASCHNVHDPANGTFLRKSNEGSALCRTCHLK